MLNPIVLSARVEILKAQSAVYASATSDLETRLDKIKEAYLGVVSEPDLRREIVDTIAIAIVDFNVGVLNVIMNQSGLQDIATAEAQ